MVTRKSIPITPLLPHHAPTSSLVSMLPAIDTTHMCRTTISLNIVSNRKQYGAHQLRTGRSLIWESVHSFFEDETNDNHDTYVPWNYRPFRPPMRLSPLPFPGPVVRSRIRVGTLHPHLTCFSFRWIKKTLEPCHTRQCSVKFLHWPVIQ